MTYSPNSFQRMCAKAIAWLTTARELTLVWIVADFLFQELGISTFTAFEFFHHIDGWHVRVAAALYGISFALFVCSVSKNVRLIHLLCKRVRTTYKKLLVS